METWLSFDVITNELFCKDVFFFKKIMMMMMSRLHPALNVHKKNKIKPHLRIMQIIGGNFIYKV